MATFPLFLLASIAAATPAPPPAPAQARGVATVRIVRPALIGAQWGAPRPGMVARTVTADGREIRVYDFE